METADGQIILEEEIDENYEPTEQEVFEYANWLGMDVEKEKDLLWIAREGLKAPLPDNWKPCKTPTGDIYYFNFQTGESIWDHPCDEFYRKLYADEKVKKHKERQQEVLKKAPAMSLAAAKPKSVHAEVLAPVRERGSMSASMDSLHNSFEASPLAPIKENPKPLGPLSRDLGLKPEGGEKQGPAPLKKTPLSGSGSDWKTPPLEDTAQQQQVKATSVVVLSKTRQAQEEERQALERKLQAEIETERAELEQQYKKKLQKLRLELEDEEAHQKRKMTAAVEMVLADYKKQMEAREEREKEELALGCKRRLQELEEQHAQQAAALRWKQQEAEEQLKAQVAAATKKLEESEAVAEQDLRSKREAALLELEQESRAWAEAQKVFLRQRAMEKVNAEVDQEMEPVRAQKWQEALCTIEADMKGLIAAKSRELSDLDAQLAARRGQLADLDVQVSEKKALAAAMETDIDSRNHQLPGLQSEVRSKREELRALDSDLTAKMAEFDDLVGAVRQKQRELDEADSELKAKKAQLDAVALDLEQQQHELAAVRERLASEHATLSKEVAEQTSKAVALQEVSAALTEKQEKLAALEAQLAVKDRELAALVSELARKRAETMTLDVSLASELRARASAEFEQLEEQLAKARKELSILSPELAHKQQLLQEQEQLLAELEQELQDKQQAAEQLSAELGELQAELHDTEALLEELRLQQLNMTSTLSACQKDLDYEAQRKALTTEEKSLLEVQRAQLERAVSEQVEAERQALLASRLASMRADVDRAVADERTSYLAQRREALQAEVRLQPPPVTPLHTPQREHQQQQQQQPLTPQRSQIQHEKPHHQLHMPSEDALHDELPLPHADLSPKLDDTPLKRAAEAAAAAMAASFAASASGGLESPHDLVRTTNDLRRSLEVLLTRAASQAAGSQAGGQAGQAAAAAGSRAWGGGGGAGLRFDGSVMDHRPGSGGSSMAAQAIARGNVAGVGDGNSNVGGDGRAAPEPEPEPVPEPGSSFQQHQHHQQQHAHGKRQQHPRQEPVDAGGYSHGYGLGYSHAKGGAVAPGKRNVRRGDLLHHATSYDGAQMLHDGGGLSLLGALDLSGCSSSSMLSKAKVFLRQQKRYIKERQAMIQQARDQWKANLAAMDLEQDPVRRQQQAALLRQVKGVLEDQVHRLNADANQLRSLKVQLQALDSSSAHGHGGVGLGVGVGHASLVDAMHHSDEGDGDESEQGMRLGFMQAGGIHQPNLRASLEKISRAVNQAIHATTGLQRNDASRAGRRRSASAGRSTAAHATAAAAAALAGRRSGLPSPAWESNPEDGSTSDDEMGSSISNGHGLAFLDRWQDDNDVARSLLQQHSSWLASFREQIGKASSIGGAVGAAASLNRAVNRGNTKASARYSSPSKPAGLPAGPNGSNGASLQGVQMLGLAAAARGGYPVCLDIGNNSELVIAVRHK